MIFICDLPMGCGKTSAAITYMNEHPEQRFMYVTPFLEEVERVKKACRASKFVEPDDRYKVKMIRLIELVTLGENIVTTHQEIRHCSKEIYQMIKEQGYTLIIDESVDLLERMTYNTEDFEIALNSGYLELSEDGHYQRSDKEYFGSIYSKMFKDIGVKEIIPIEDKWRTQGFYWRIPPEMITSFEDVFVLTYLFDCQSLYAAFKMYGIDYEYIGVAHEEDGTYRFGPSSSPLPEYLSHLHEKIHILDEDKMNDVGKDRCALSASWFGKPTSDVERLRRNVDNYFKHKAPVPAKERMWGTYKDAKEQVEYKGYKKQFVAFNSRATNKYRHKTTLAYCVNVFMHVGQKQFYKTNGVDINDDNYALSIMIQWIWRSAIRDGKDINIYIPSRRMRELLIGWMDNLEVMN